MAKVFDTSLVNAMESIMQANYHILVAINPHRPWDSETLFELKKLMENNNDNAKILLEIRNDEKIYESSLKE